MNRKVLHPFAVINNNNLIVKLFVKQTTVTPIKYMHRHNPASGSFRTPQSIRQNYDSNPRRTTRTFPRKGVVIEAATSSRSQLLRLDNATIHVYKLSASSLRPTLENMQQNAAGYFRNQAMCLNRLSNSPFIAIIVPCGSSVLTFCCGRWTEVDSDSVVAARAL